MAINKLSELQVKRTKKTLGDGGGLTLRVTGESKSWIFRYTLNGKASVMGLGGLAETGLADARKQAEIYREYVRKGVDPKEERDDSGYITPDNTPTFMECATTYINNKRPEWKNQKHGDQWVSTIETYAKPIIGSKPVDQIQMHHIEKILDPIWNDITETAKRLQGRIENILDWAKIKGYRSGDNPARWRGNLSEMYPSPSKLKKRQNDGEERHLLAMPYTDVGKFMQKLKEQSGLAAKSLQFLILTACRTSEVLKATWEEIDLNEKTWTIPAGRMKAGKMHRVPLTDTMIQLLKDLPKFVDEQKLGDEITHTAHLFPGQKKGHPLSDMSMIVLLRKMGYVKNGKHDPYVPHGFRSSFRDWAEEQTSHPRGVVEKALAHTLQNKVERAYQRGDLLQKRAILMEDWDLYLRRSGRDEG